MSKINCHLVIHSKAAHLNQLYTGFFELYKRGFINLEIEKNISTTEHILEVIVNDSKRIIYDTFDQGNKYASKINLNDVDFYFKRSYNFEVHNNFSTKIRPLGLFYHVFNQQGNLLGKREFLFNKLKKIVKNKGLDFTIEDFEYFPKISQQPKVLFLTRLWDPDAPEVENEIIRKERIEINKFRIACIKECKKQFAESFIGGVEENYFSRRKFSDCIVEDNSITKRSNFLKLIKNSDICVATTGLHKSIGGKIGEYAAASRAIVTEPLHFSVPGNFVKNNNFLEFESVDDLTRSIKYLIENKDFRFEMMKNNFKYYNNYVRPDVLVLNTLLECIN